jgi:hypothetical protein
LRQEKLTLISELQSAKEKLHSCEALVARLGKRERGDDSQADVLDHQLNSLTQQVYAEPILPTLFTPRDGIWLFTPWGGLFIIVQ